MIAYGDLLTILLIIVVVLLIVLLFQLIVVSAALKRFANRVDTLSQEIETIVLKPLGAIEHAMDWIVGLIEGYAEGKKEKKHGKKHVVKVEEPE